VNVADVEARFLAVAPWDCFFLSLLANLPSNEKWNWTGINNFTDEKEKKKLL